MKKVLLLSIMFVLVMFGIQGVGAEEIIEPVITEPTAWENWLNALTDFASLKNALVSVGSLAGLVTLLKVRGLYKFLKSPDGLIVIEKFALKLISKISESPETILNITKTVFTLPVMKNILDKAEAKAGLYELELQGKILDIEAKLSAKVFEEDKLPEAIAYLQKLRDEYETITTTE